jgi:rhamnogalacturonan endolyase
MIHFFETRDIGLDVNLGEITFHPPRQGKTKWEIGIPDRSASEFFIPDPNPSYINRLFVNHPER